MRIVSQNREFDTPYEKVLLYVLKRSEKYHIFVSFGYDETYDYSIGAYKTKDRCLEVMQEIREAAIGEPIAYDFLPEKDFNRLIKEMRELPVQNLTISDNNVRVNGETYFYMPEE